MNKNGIEEGMGRIPEQIQLALLLPWMISFLFLKYSSLHYVSK